MRSDEARAGIVLALLALAACAADAPSPVDRPPPWTLRPVSRIGDEADPRTALTTPADVVQNSAGTVFLLQRGVPEVAVFDADGRPVGRIGRSGAGPGEFVRPAALGFRGDTLWVRDVGSAKLVLYRPDGTHLRDVRFTIPPAGPGHGVLVPLAPLSDGGVLAGPGGIPISRVLRGEFTVAPLLRASSEGVVRDTIVMIPLLARDFFQVGLEDGASLVGRHPLPDEPRWALAAAGDRMIVAERAAAAGSPASFRVTAITLRGDTLWSREYPYRPIRVSRQWRDDWFAAQADAFAASRPGFPRAAVERAYRRDLAMPEHFPPITNIIAGSDGTIWLRREDLGPAVRWQVLDAGGRPLGELSMPREWRVLDASRSGVWVGETGPLDVPRLLRLRVEARG